MAVLVACGNGTIGENDVIAEPCTIEEYQPPGAVLGGTRLQPALDQSPDYCADEVVLEDYRAAMEFSLWYDLPIEGTACENISPPIAYPTTLIDELSNFYTGELLHIARETIYYNQQANPRRIVLACWDVTAFRSQFDENTVNLEVEWEPDGQHVIVKQTIQDYTLLIYEIRDGQPELVDTIVDDQASGRSFWDTTMVYGDNDGASRWKILRAENTIPGSR
jgi:hypothetical protein